MYKARKSSVSLRYAEHTAQQALIPTHQPFLWQNELAIGDTQHIKQEYACKTCTIMTTWLLRHLPCL